MSHEAHEDEVATKASKNTKAFSERRDLRARDNNFVTLVARTKR
jgi:hypothetical protein